MSRDGQRVEVEHFKVGEEDFVPIGGDDLRGVVDEATGVSWPPVIPLYHGGRGINGAGTESVRCREEHRQWHNMDQPLHVLTRVTEAAHDVENGCSVRSVMWAWRDMATHRSAVSSTKKLPLVDGSRESMEMNLWVFERRSQLADDSAVRGPELQRVDFGGIRSIDEAVEEETSGCEYLKSDPGYQVELIAAHALVKAGLCKLSRDR